MIFHKDFFPERKILGKIQPSTFNFCFLENLIISADFCLNNGDDNLYGNVDNIFPVPHFTGCLLYLRLDIL